jgi:1-deoxy-D-xylulose-5-phosphate reductoisomerase
MQSITILGSTGSIGVNALDVISRHPDRYRVFALTCHRQIGKLIEQCRQYAPAFAVVDDEAAAEKVQAGLNSSGLATRVMFGSEGLMNVAADEHVDCVIAAIVGFAGLAPALAAARSGKRLLLANKEALVTAGGLFMRAVADGGAQLIPLDSEHSAIFQVLPHHENGVPDVSAVRRMILTASGGPFREATMEAIRDATPEQAIAHPNWSMGKKISVDSATMMNKGLEVIEARWLFDMPVENIEVVVHPESVVHSMVEFRDGSVLAQLGDHDMRGPIAYALGYPERIASGTTFLDFPRLKRLHFDAPDLKRFPCLRLAFEALNSGGSSAVVLNAANEVAVAAFLERKIRFLDIPGVIESTLSSFPAQEIESLDEVNRVDAEARAQALICCDSLAGVTH